LIVNESDPPEVAKGAVTVMGVTCSAPAAPVLGTVPTVMAVGAISAAEAGATEVRTPNPKADTTTSAMRFSDVFVDIDFLSLVVNETFSFTAGRERLSAS
jgi:hypothetical protein